ncbi:MAG: hypothetical protein ACRYG4_12490 [Janthinobacterium lividum]
MSEAPSPAPRDDRLARAVATAHAIGALDGALAASPVARFWRERAAIVGLAACLGLAGATLTPAEFFRAGVGLVEPVFFAEVDRALVGMITAAALPDLAPNSMTGRIVARLDGSRLFPGDDWAAGRRPSGATRAAVSAAIGTVARRADVGTALPDLTVTLVAALAVLRGCAEAEWHGWLIAARLPALLARAGITTTPLPCLTGLTRSMRYVTADAAAVEDGLLPRLTEQARDGLAMLRRLEACAIAWRDRLAGLTARSRAGEAAGLFLVWPACTRPQLAAALGATQAGAGGVLDVLVARGIVERRQQSGTTFYVARESLGEFKLEARQGRHAAPPRMTAVAEFDAAMAVLDLLDGPRRDDLFATRPEAYQHQP